MPITEEDGVGGEGGQLGSVPVATLPPVLAIQPVLPWYVVTTQWAHVLTGAGTQAATHPTHPDQ